MALSAAVCYHISECVACREGEVEWIPFQKSPLGDRYLSFLSDDMQEGEEGWMSVCGIGTGPGL